MLVTSGSYRNVQTGALNYQLTDVGRRERRLSQVTVEIDKWQKGCVVLCAYTPESNCVSTKPYYSLKWKVRTRRNTYFSMRLSWVLRLEFQRVTAQQTQVLSMAHIGQILN
jgi:hypothetical protein